MEMKDASGDVRGVKVDHIASDDSELRKVYAPENPEADADGYVSYPNVNVVTEMVDLIAAQRAYEANATVIESAKTNFMHTLAILQT
jgi:flagellar basal-body rod protein FlgC